MGTCTVIVRYYNENGKPAAGIKVQGWCDPNDYTNGTQRAYTDEDGVAELEWSSWRDIYSLHVDGREVRQNVSDGETITVAID